jgi:hypothetical protein
MSSFYPSKNKIAEEGINKARLERNEICWQNIKGFIPKNPLYYHERLNAHLALPIYDFIDNNLLGYQLRNCLVNPIDFDGRYQLSNPISGFLYKPDSDEIDGTPVILESLYEAALLRKFGINAAAILGVKIYRINKVNELLEGDFYCIGDNDTYGYTMNKRLTGQPIAFDRNYKDLDDFFRKDEKAFLDLIKFIKELTNQACASSA